MKLTKAERAARQALKAAQPPAIKEPTIKEPKLEKTRSEAPAPRVRQPLTPVPIERWTGCYDESWRGFITPASFAHPAKAGRALLGKIYDRLFALGALKIGSVVLDPFGGIGTTGIIGAYRRCCVICHELEPKFVALANDNMQMHVSKWEMIGAPIPRIIQGDSRKLRQNIREAQAIVSSPPYIQGGHHSTAWNLDATTNSEEIRRARVAATRGVAPEEITDKFGTYEYGTTAGQMGEMPQGDIDAVVSSPPYSAIASGAGGLNTQPAKDASQQTGRTLGASQDTDQRYGDSVGQLAKLPEGEVNAIVSSPPYASQDVGATRRELDKYDQGQIRDQRIYGETHGQLGALSEGHIDAIISSPPYADQPLRPDESSRPEAKIERLVAEGQYEAAERVRQHCSGAASNLRQQDYGATKGQLGALQAGEIDAVISSPPYTEEVVHGRPSKMTKEIFKDRTASTGLGAYGDEVGQLGTMEASCVDAVISSPPYAETLLNDDQRQAGKGEKLRWGTNEEYGTSPGQLGVLKEEAGVDAVISSPPYAETSVLDFTGKKPASNQSYSSKQIGEDVGYGETTGQLGAMKTEGVDAVISSPPFGSGDSASAQSIVNRTDKSAQWVKANCGSAATEGYGDDPGQLAQMSMDASVDAVLTSPPYSASGLGASQQSEGPNGRPNDNAGASQPLDQYGTTAGQLNHAPDDTFWTAARDIVRECHTILKPGGYAVWIVKAFVRDKQIVDFPGDWRRLCEYVGFETVTEVQAMLVRETEFTDVFGEERVEKKERKSFFRRLAESKGSPKIDHEVVWIMRKRV